MVDIGFLLGLAIYGLVWFLTLFMVLPFGVVAQNEADEIVPGSSPSAPTKPHIGRKLLITTLVAGIFYGGIYWLLTSGVVAMLGKFFLPQV